MQYSAKKKEAKNLNPTIFLKIRLDGTGSLVLTH